MLKNHIRSPSKTNETNICHSNLNHALTHKQSQSWWLSKCQRALGWMDGWIDGGKDGQCLSLGRLLQHSLSLSWLSADQLHLIIPSPADWAHMSSQAPAALFTPSVTEGLWLVWSAEGWGGGDDWRATLWTQGSHQWKNFNTPNNADRQERKSFNTPNKADRQQSQLVWRCIYYLFNIYIYI